MLNLTLRTIETDYFVIGGGAMGVAFIDEVMIRDKTARFVLVDKHARAGGHWNDAYSFVKLHQPAAYYGVNSEPLGPGGASLVSGTEVVAYYERVMEKLLATGRLEYFPLCESSGNGRFHSLVDDGVEYEVKPRRRTVDATYMKVEVPSTRPPQYEVAEGMTLVPVNGLSEIREPWSSYVIVGAGKTGIDAILFLLKMGIDPDHIEWIMPNDSWLDNRKNTTPGQITKGLYHLKDWVKGNSLEEVFLNREQVGEVFRLDPSIWPTKYKCATVDEEEFEQLKRVKNIVRLGRVMRIGPDSIELEKGTIPTDSKKLHVDCTADGLARREVRPIFDGYRLTLQSVATCQQVFSAALIGYVETRFKDDATKNDLCQVVAHPEYTKDWVRIQKLAADNTLKWLAKFPLWVLRSRLSFQAHESILETLIAGVRLRKDVNALTNELLPKLYAQEFPDEPVLETQMAGPRAITEGVWEMACPVSPGPGMKLATRMTILRLEDDSLLLHSPTQLDATQVKAINELGTVRHLVSPNLFHWLFLKQATEHWPTAKVWGPPDLATKAKDVQSFEVLKSGSPWPGVEVVELAGCPQLQEFALFHRPSSTLVLTDLVFNEATGENFGGRLFLRLSGVYKKWGISRVIRPAIKDKAAFGKSLPALFELPIERVIVAHGEVLESNAKARLREVLSPLGA